MSELANKGTPFVDAIESARDGRQMLKVLTEGKNAIERVASLSPDDLYLCLQVIGIADSESVLALASGEQVRGLIDIDCWARDSFQMERLNPWLNALMRAGPEVLTRRLLDLDDSLLTHLIRNHVDAYVVEDPDNFEAPDALHVFTPDSQTCLVFKTEAAENLPIRIFLDTLMRFDTAHCLNLLAHLNSALPSTLEEQSYRWRSGRMSDLGYVEYYEALKIYAPLPKGYVYLRPTLTNGFKAGIRTLSVERSSTSNSILSEVIQRLPNEQKTRFHFELGLVTNMALSADRVELWDAAGQHEVMVRIRRLLELGVLLSVTNADSLDQCAASLASRGAIQLFRFAYQQLKETVAPLTSLKARKQCLAGDDDLGALDIFEFKQWAERLTRKHPTIDDFVCPQNLTELSRMALWTSRIVHLTRIASTRPINTGMVNWLWTRFLKKQLDADGETLSAAQLIEFSQSNQLESAKTRQLFADAFSEWLQEQSESDVSDLAQTIFDEPFEELRLIGIETPEDFSSLSFISI